MNNAEHEILVSNKILDLSKINVLAMGKSCIGQCQVNNANVCAPTHILSYGSHPYDLSWIPEYEMIKDEFRGFVPENVIGATLLSKDSKRGIMFGEDQFYYGFAHYGSLENCDWNRIRIKCDTLIDRLKDGKRRLIYTYIDGYSYNKYIPNEVKEVVIRRLENKDIKTIITNVNDFHKKLLNLHPCPRQIIVVGIGTQDFRKWLQPIYQSDDVMVYWVNHIWQTKYEKIRKEAVQKGFNDVVRIVDFTQKGINVNVLIKPMLTLMEEAYRES